MIIMNSTEKLDYLLQKNNGYIKTADAVASGLSRVTFIDYVNKYGLQRVAHGCYMSSEAWEDKMFVIQMRYPEAVFSHETALFLLGITDREPSKFSLTLKTGKNSARLAKENIKVYKVKEELFDIGISKRETPTGNTVRVYNIERTLCDLFRSRRNIEFQELQNAVKFYLKKRDKNLPLLMRIAKAFSVERIVRQYLEILL